MSLKAFRRTRLCLILLVFLAGCSAGEPQTPKLFSAPDSLSSLGSVHSPSAMEAISRGVAAVTPPGAALKDVYYPFDSVELEPEAQEILKKNAEWMKANPKARVEVEGHCDDIGSAEYNLALGAKRAQTARDFLINQGIAEGECTPLRLLNESGAEKSFGVGGSPAEQPAKKASEIRQSRVRRNAVSDKIRSLVGSCKYAYPRRFDVFLSSFF